MQVNLNKVIKDYKDEDVLEQKQEKIDDAIKITNIPLTFKSVFLQALNNTMPNEVYSVEQKVHANILSIDIYKNDSIDLTPEDIIFIKERVGIMWNDPSVYAATIKLLEGKEEGEQPAN